MIIFNESISNDDFHKILKTEEIQINKQLNTFNSYREIFLMYMRKSLKNIEYIGNSKKSPDILSNFQSLLDKSHVIESCFKNIFSMHQKLANYSDSIGTQVQEYNTLENILNESLYSYIIELKGFIQNFSDSIDFILESPDNDAKNVTVTENIDKQHIQGTLHTESLDSNPVEKTLKFQPIEESIDTNPAKETLNSQSTQESNITGLKNILTDNNSLIISEKKQKVFLPYKIKNLEKQLSTSKKYSDIITLIEQEYIVPLSRFKNPIISRFKEAYYLMRNKESSSFLEAIDLALELFLNSTLNPAVIAACKNKDELDIYLDCLHEKELQNFKVFDIIYEING